MEYIKIAQVPDAVLHKKGNTVKGVLHLTTHHLIFTLPQVETAPRGSQELWLCYPMIERVTFTKGSALLYAPDKDESFQLTKGANLRIICRDYTFLAFDFTDVKQCNDVFESLLKLTCVNSLENLYAFLYSPVKIEAPLNGWKIYEPLKEFERQGLKLNSPDSSSEHPGDKMWRMSNINETYRVCTSYPSVIVTPASISNSVLHHASKFRSKGRMPALTYYHKYNGCSIIRCSQPLVGLKQNRSLQDEKLLLEITRTNEASSVLIVDARPVANAIAQTALGAGSEIVEYYPNAKKVFLNIDNIHVIRDSLNKVTEALKNTDISMEPPNQDLLIKSGWLKLIYTVLTGLDMIVKSLHLNKQHLLLHCSDGWDRTSQLAALAQLLLDPYYRTLEGIMVLIEKDWLSFGHRFNERSGHLQSETKFVDNSEYSSTNQAQHAIKQVTSHFRHRKHVKYTSPIFHQFLDCIYQLLKQNPTIFEFNERFLRRLLYHLYSCQYGTFLYDSELERRQAKVSEKTRSVWDYFLARKSQFVNPDYKRLDEVVYPDLSKISFWYELFGRTDEELNGFLNESSASSGNIDTSIYYESQTKNETAEMGIKLQETQTLLSQVELKE
ncbi:BA75_00375T0 [Komagataella pastoris]|uniref:BA75_00375T0 n=1 Tax=Komagataella pastoris TaxID=4922 RepID=A0A1B2J550_PICPA|nr:BA75_00375T0 [Komagataella pastoris]